MTWILTRREAASANLPARSDRNPSTLVGARAASPLAFHAPHPTPPPTPAAPGSLSETPGEPSRKDLFFLVLGRGPPEKSPRGGCY